jgi:hypothetical protein
LVGSAKPKIIFEFVDWAENGSALFSPGDTQRFLLDKQYQLYLLNEYRAVVKKPINAALENGSFEIVAIPLE